MSRRKTYAILAATTAGFGLLLAPLCWFMKDGLLGAYPSYGIGAVSHFFWSLLWGLWPVATLLLLLKVVQSRAARVLCIALLALCAFFFLVPLKYSKAFIEYWEEPFVSHNRTTLYDNNTPLTVQWPEYRDIPDSDRKLWEAWQDAHNSTHCWRCSPGRITRPLLFIQLVQTTIIIGEEEVCVTIPAGTFTRPRNTQDTLLLNRMRELAT